MDIDRRGSFSFVDLLVTLGSVGSLLVLCALLLGCGAVEQAGRVACKNNLNMLALATISFESSQRRYPGYAETVGEKPAGWMVAILPQLDHHDWYDEWADPSVALADAPKRYSELFICPSEPPKSRSGPFNSYVINAGAAPVENERPANGIAHDYRASGMSTDGYILSGPHTSAEYVAANDGASYTLLLSENVQAGEWHLADKQSNVFVWHPDGLNNQPRRKINGYSQEDGSLMKVPLTADSARPSSFHSRGVNVVFCDRRSIFLSEDIEYTVYMQLMTPNGRESDMPADAKARPLSDSDYTQVRQRDPASVLACCREP